MGKCVLLLTIIFATHFRISTKQIDLQTLKSIEQTKKIIKQHLKTITDDKIQMQKQKQNQFYTNRK